MLLGVLKTYRWATEYPKIAQILSARSSDLGKRDGTCPCLTYDVIRFTIADSVSCGEQPTLGN